MYIINNNSKSVDSTLSMELFCEEYRKSPWKKVLYIHIPYCPSKCKYCICKSEACAYQKIADDYALNVLIPQLKQMSMQTAGINFSELYIGGGTPTYLSPIVLDKVLQSIPNINSIPVKSIEASPTTIQFEHIELIKKYSFQYISLGIQSLQKNVCTWQNRPYVTHEELLHLSDVLRKSELYFNYDLICYLGYGDLRDIPGFDEDVDFIMSDCKPSSINVHQLQQSIFTIEKVHAVQKVLIEKMEKYPDYECINSRLLHNDLYKDVLFQAQYRMVREKRNFMHYMWNKYPEIPVYGYDIFSVGYTDRISPKSNAGDLVYRPGTQRLSKHVFNIDLYNDFYEIRKEKMLDDKN